MKRQQAPQVQPPVRAAELEGRAFNPAVTPVAENEPQHLVNQVEVWSPYVGRWLRTIARWALVGLALYTIYWLLRQSFSALTPFIFGLVLAYLLTPIVNWLNRRMPRGLSILLVYIVGIGLLVGAVNFIVPPIVDQGQELIQSIPTLDEIQNEGTLLFDQLQSAIPEDYRQPVLDGLNNSIDTVQANLTTYVQRVGSFLIDQVIGVFNTVAFLIGFLIIPIWLFYVLNDQRQGRNFIDRLLHRRIRADFWNTWDIVNGTFLDYVRGQLILCLSIGIATFIGLFALQLFGINVDYILVLAIIAGLTEFIPVIGPIIGAIPAIVLALFSGDPSSAIWVTLVYIIIQQLENNILVPRIIGDSVDVHAAVLMVLLIIMGQIFGLIGVILAAPLAAIARDMFIYTYRRLEGLSPAVVRAQLKPKSHTATSISAVADLRAYPETKQHEGGV